MLPIAVSEKTELPRERVIVLYSDKITTDLNKLLDEPFRLLNQAKPLQVALSQRDAIDFLTEPIRHNTTLLVVLHPDDKEMWRDIINDSKSRDPFTELILVVSEDSLSTSEITQVLSGGYYAYFEWEYEPQVLAGYISAAYDRINRRRDRFGSSQELNSGMKTLKEAADIILEQLKKLVNYDRATITLLSEREYLYSDIPIRSLVRTLVQKEGYESVGWRMLRPVKDDRLIEAVLDGSLKRQVFKDVRRELKEYGWDESEQTRDINSWIVLRLRYLGEIIGIITLDAVGDNVFSYADINELTLLQFANQAALTLVSAQQSESAMRLKAALTAVAEQTERDAVLHTIAQEACRLVDGIYSYVVLANTEETDLTFKGVGLPVGSPGERLDDPQERLLEQLKEKVVKFPIAESEDKIKDGEGITILAYVRKRPVILDDCQRVFNTDNKISLSDTDPNAYRVFKLFNADDDDKILKDLIGTDQTKADIAIPIVSDGDLTTDGKPKVLGVINIEHKNPCAFTHMQIETLQEFARFAAIAIKTQNAKKRIARLFKASNDATSVVRPKRDNIFERDMLKRLANETESTAGADGGVKIFAFVDGTTVLRGHSTSANVPNDNQKASMPRRFGHTLELIKRAQGNINEKNERTAIPSVDSHNRNVDKYREEYVTDYRVIKVRQETVDAGDKALLCLPLWLEDTVIGAMWLHYKQVQQFTEEELEDLQLYANRAAVALHNDTEQALLEISEKLTKMRDNSHEVAQTIVDFLKEQFGLEGALFYVVEPFRGRWDGFRGRLKLFASTQDSKEGPWHMPVGKIVRYGQGVAGHHFRGRAVGDTDYTKTIVPIEDYRKLPPDQQIEEDLATGKLHSLLSIRLEVPPTGKTVGILILNGEQDRIYSDSKHDIVRFAELTTNLLALVKFSRPGWISGSLFFISLLALIVTIQQIVPMIYSGLAEQDILKAILIIIQIVANIALVLISGINIIGWKSR